MTLICVKMPCTLRAVSLLLENLWGSATFEYSSSKATRSVLSVLRRTGARKRRCSRSRSSNIHISHSFTDIRANERLGSQSYWTKSDHGSFCYNLLVRNNNNEFTSKIDELETTTRGLNDKRKNSKTGLASVPMETPSINGCESIQKIDLKKLLLTW